MGELIFTFAYGGGLIVIGLFSKHMLIKEETQKEEAPSFNKNQKVIIK